eukprot:1133565-Pelagomonas_calceolata.AAC.1
MGRWRNAAGLQEVVGVELTRVYLEQGCGIQNCCFCGAAAAARAKQQLPAGVSGAAVPPNWCWHAGNGLEGGVGPELGVASVGGGGWPERLHGAMEECCWAPRGGGWGAHAAA